LQGNVKTTYSAANQVILSPGFHTGINSNFRSVIQPCITFRSMNPEGAIKSSDENSFSAYPNPFNDKLSFSLNLDNDEQVTIKIYNSQMQLIDAIKNNELLKKGENIFDYSGAKLEAGLYFISIQTSSSSKTLKIIKID